MSNSLASVQKMLIKCSPPLQKRKNKHRSNSLKTFNFYLEADMKTSILKTHGSMSIHRSPTQKLCGDPWMLCVSDVHDLKRSTSGPAPLGSLFSILGATLTWEGNSFFFRKPLPWLFRKNHLMLQISSGDFSIGVHRFITFGGEHLSYQSSQKR